MSRQFTEGALGITSHGSREGPGRAGSSRGRGEVVVMPSQPGPSLGTWELG